MNENKHKMKNKEERAVHGTQELMTFIIFLLVLFLLIDSRLESTGDFIVDLGC